MIQQQQLLVFQALNKHKNKRYNSSLRAAIFLYNRPRINILVGFYK
jgi:hypothetical protein